MASKQSHSSAAPSGVAVSVLGVIPAHELGHTQPHEHVLLDTSAPYLVENRPDPSQLSEVELDMFERPIELASYDWIRRHCLNRDNLQLLDESEAGNELALYRASGGGTIVDSTPRDLGRDPAGLARVSRATGVAIVMGSGWYTHEYHPPTVAQASEEELFEVICRDLIAGDETSQVRAGLVGEIGLSWPVHPDEEKVLRAAVGAQVATGAPLQIHPGRHPAAPFHAMQTVRQQGGRADRTIVSHIERTLFSLEAMLELAATGCYLEFDLFGQESSYYPWAPIDMPNDARRIDYLISLVGAGHLQQLLVSQDICYKVYLRRYGGPGYAHILDNVLPMMRRKGMSDDEVHTITVENPARILTVADACGAVRRGSPVKCETSWDREAER